MEGQASALTAQLASCWQQPSCGGVICSLSDTLLAHGGAFRLWSRCIMTADWYWHPKGISSHLLWLQSCCWNNDGGGCPLVSYPGRLGNSYGGWSVSQYSCCSFGFIGHHISAVIGWWGYCTTLKWETHHHAYRRRRTTTAQIYYPSTPSKLI